MGFLIDTCIWIDVERGVITPEAIEAITKKHPVYISPVIIAELTYGMEISKNDTIRTERSIALNRLRKIPAVFIDEMCGEIFGRITTSLKKKGKQSHYRIQDIWLAAQAIQNNFFFLTYNLKDFKDIDGLKLVEFKKD